MSPKLQWKTTVKILDLPNMQRALKRRSKSQLYFLEALLKNLLYSSWSSYIHHLEQLKVLAPTCQTTNREEFCADDSHSGGGSTFEDAIAAVTVWWDFDENGDKLAIRGGSTFEDAIAEDWKQILMRLMVTIIFNKGGRGSRLARDQLWELGRNTAGSE